jgi:hypothetical protein
VAAGREESRELDEVAAFVAEHARAALEGSVDATSIDRLEHTTSYRMNTMGYMRYFDKLEAS